MNASPETPAVTKPKRLTRRAALVLGAGAVATGGAIAAQWFNIFAQNGTETLTPTQAHQAAERGDVVLVDIRRPDEWAATGVGEGAQAIDMRRPDFTKELLSRAGTTDRAIALICARGVRSRRLSQALNDAGFTRIIDIPEGMLGSGAGPGWLATGLPVVFPTG
ncbi:MAG: rhodanese-like domain-containing protein [Roseobacter sp.]